MFPIGDNDSPNRRIPIVTWILIAINAFVFLYELLLTAPDLERLIMNWGVVPSRITGALANPGAPGSLEALATLITSQFLHGGWMHIIGNMLFLFIFGDDVEDTMGSPIYLLFYLACGIIAGLVQTFVLSSMAGAANQPGIGASGAIAGVLGAYLVLFPGRRVRVLMPSRLGGMGTGEVSAIVMLGFWFVQNLLSGFAALTPGAGASTVGFWAHIGGFVAGVLFALPFKGRVRRTTADQRIYTS
jgi:membrane associated rhomboid family serine protease